MADECDRAADYQAKQNEQSLLAARQQSRIAPMYIDGERVCRDCYDVIEPERIKASPNAVRCTECQEREERKRGLF